MQYSHAICTFKELLAAVIIPCVCTGREAIPLITVLETCLNAKVFMAVGNYHT